MSGVDDFKTVSDCYDYKTENYLLKPITKQNFQIEKMKIMKHLEKKIEDNKKRRIKTI